MPEQFITIPDYVIKCEMLSPQAKVFYGFLCWHMNEKGYTEMTNAELAIKYCMTARTVCRYLQLFRELEFIVVESNNRERRKIWSKETWKAVDRGFELNEMTEDRRCP